MKLNMWVTNAIPLAAVILVLAGCGRGPAGAVGAGPRTVEKHTIRIDGSTTLHPVFEEIVRVYRAAHPEVAIDLRQSGSGTGVRRLVAGEIDLALASRDLKQSELDAGKNVGKMLRAFLIGHDALGVIVHPDIFKRITHLNRDQVRQVFFDGTISDWSQLDPALKGQINVYTRDATSSGTGSVFNELITGSELTPYVTRTKVVEETPQLVNAVAKDPLGIAFAPFADLRPGVQAVEYGTTDAELVACTLPAVRSDRYRLKRDLNIVVAMPMSAEVSEFIDFVTSEPGQALVAKYRFATIN